MHSAKALRQPLPHIRLRSFLYLTFSVRKDLWSCQPAPALPIISVLGDDPSSRVHRWVLPPTDCGFSWHLKCIRVPGWGEGQWPQSIPYSWWPIWWTPKKLVNKILQNLKQKQNSQKSSETKVWGLLTSQLQEDWFQKQSKIGFVFPVRISNQTFQAANLALLSFSEMLFIFSPQPTILQTGKFCLSKSTRATSPQSGRGL